MKFILTLCIVFYGSRLLRPLIGKLQQRIRDAVAAQKFEPSPADIVMFVVAIFIFGTAWQTLDRFVLTLFLFWLGWTLLRPVIEGAGQTLSEAVSEAARSQREGARAEAKRPRASLREKQAVLARRRQAQIDQLEIAQPREQTDAESPEDSWKSLPAPKKARQTRKARRRGARQRPSLAEVVDLRSLDMDDIRNGIVMAEILGAPKGLRDIDSHVV